MISKSVSQKLVSSIVAVVMLFSSFGWSSLSGYKYLRAPGDGGVSFKEAFPATPAATTTGENSIERWVINLFKTSVLRVFDIGKDGYAESATAMTAVVSAITMLGTGLNLDPKKKDEKARIKAIKDTVDGLGKAIFQKIADQQNVILMVRVNEGFRDEVLESFKASDIIVPEQLKGQEEQIIKAIEQNLDKYTAPDGTVYKIENISADVIEGTNQFVINVGGKPLAVLARSQAGTTSIVAVGDIVRDIGDSSDVYTNVFAYNVPEKKKQEFIDKPINPEDHARDPKTVVDDLGRLAEAKGLTMEEYMNNLDYVVMDRGREIAKLKVLIDLKKQYKGFEYIVIPDGTVAPSIAAILGQKEGREVIVDTIGGAPEGFFVGAVAALFSKTGMASWTVYSKNVNKAKSRITLAEIEANKALKEEVVKALKANSIVAAEIEGVDVTKDAVDMGRRYDFTNKSSVELPTLSKSVSDALSKVNLEEGNKIKYKDRSLVFEGIMTEEEKNDLLKISSYKTYQKAIESLFETSNETERAEIIKLRSKYGDDQDILKGKKLFTEQIAAGKDGKICVSMVTHNGVFGEDGVKRLVNGNYQVGMLRMEKVKREPKAWIEHVIVPQEQISKFLRSLKDKTETAWVNVLIKELALNQNIKLNEQMLNSLREVLRLINGNEEDIINQEYKINKMICEKLRITKISDLDVLSNKPKLNFVAIKGVPATTAVIEALKGIVEIDAQNKVVKVLNVDKLRDSLIDKLVYDATHNPNKDVVTLCRNLIEDIASLMGAVIESPYERFTEKGKDKRKYSWPAINVRGNAYHTARADFASMVLNRVKYAKKEIAKSEIKYTNQRPAEFKTTILAAAIKEGYVGPIYLQGDHFQVALKDYSENPDEAIKEAKKLIKEAVVEGNFRAIDLDCSPLVNWTKEDFIRSVVKIREVIETTSVKKLLKMAEEAKLISNVEEGSTAIEKGQITEESLKNDLLTHWKESADEELKKIKEDKTNINILDMSLVEAWLQTVKPMEDLKDIDVSQLEAWLEIARYEQQKDNAKVSAELTAYVRQLERDLGLDKQNIIIDLGVEVGEIGKGMEKGKERNTIPEDIYAFHYLYMAELGARRAGYDILPAGRIAVMTGTKHGGVRVEGGIVAKKVKVGFNDLAKANRAARSLGYAGGNQHGASTLPEEYFVIFAGNTVPEGFEISEDLLDEAHMQILQENPTAEVHLATAYMKAMLDHPMFPAALRALIKLHIEEKFPTKEGGDREKDFEENVKNAMGPFKVQLWNLDSAIQDAIRKDLSAKFDTVYKNLGVAGLDYDNKVQSEKPSAGEPVVLTPEALEEMLMMVETISAMDIIPAIKDILNSKKVKLSEVAILLTGVSQLDDIAKKTAAELLAKKSTGEDDVAKIPTETIENIMLDISTIIRTNNEIHKIVNEKVKGLYPEAFKTRLEFISQAIKSTDMERTYGDKLTEKILTLVSMGVIGLDEASELIMYIKGDQREFIKSQITPIVNFPYSQEYRKKEKEELAKGFTDTVTEKFGPYAMDGNSVYVTNYIGGLIKKINTKAGERFEGTVPWQKYYRKHFVSEIIVNLDQLVDAILDLYVSGDIQDIQNYAKDKDTLLDSAIVMAVAFIYPGYPNYYDQYISVEAAAKYLRVPEKELEKIRARFLISKIKKEYSVKKDIEDIASFIASKKRMSSTTIPEMIKKGIIPETNKSIFTTEESLITLTLFHFGVFTQEQAGRILYMKSDPTIEKTEEEIGKLIGRILSQFRSGTVVQPEVAAKKGDNKLVNDTGTKLTYIDYMNKSVVDLEKNPAFIAAQKEVSDALEKTGKAEYKDFMKIMALFYMPLPDKVNLYSVRNYIEKAFITNGQKVKSDVIRADLISIYKFAKPIGGNSAKSKEEEERDIALEKLQSKNFTDLDNQINATSPAVNKVAEEILPILKGIVAKDEGDISVETEVETVIIPDNLIRENLGSIGAVNWLKELVEIINGAGLGKNIRLYAQALPGTGNKKVLEELGLSVEIKEGNLEEVAAKAKQESKKVVVAVMQGDNRQLPEGCQKVEFMAPNPDKQEINILALGFARLVSKELFLANQELNAMLISLAKETLVSQGFEELEAKELARKFIIEPTVPLVKVSENIIKDWSAYKTALELLKKA